MTPGANPGDPTAVAYSESRKLYYRLRRQRYGEMVASAGGGDPVAERKAEHQLAERDQQIAKLEADLAGLRDLALRARAELDNARKRFRRDKAETIKFANENLVRELIEIVDNLERAIQSAESASDVKALSDGVRMVFQQFFGLLQQKGLEVIASDGQQFDPHFHEAVSAEESEDVEDNQILGTLQKGYILAGRVVRPAMVRVARAVKPPVPEEVPQEAETAEEAEGTEEAATEEVPDESERPTEPNSEEALADLDDTASEKPDTEDDDTADESAEAPDDEAEIDSPEDESEASSPEKAKDPPPDVKQE